tara:strand:+ start:418 stop:708 length:291 start_codon:yes stop_codon:yes gene_type:complete
MRTPRSVAGNGTSYLLKRVYLLKQKKKKSCLPPNSRKSRLVAPQAPRRRPFLPNEKVPKHSTQRRMRKIGGPLLRLRQGGVVCPGLRKLAPELAPQ